MVCETTTDCFWSQSNLEWPPLLRNFGEHNNQDNMAIFIDAEIQFGVVVAGSHPKYLQ